MLGKKEGPNPKRKVVPVLGAAGLSLSLVGGASAAGAQVADGPTHKAVVSHEITLGEEEIADVSLATFYVFDKENAGPSRHSVRRGMWLLDGHLLHIRKRCLRAPTSSARARDRAEARFENPAASTPRLNPLSTTQDPAVTPRVSYVLDRTKRQTSKNRRVRWRLLGRL